MRPMLDFRRPAPETESVATFRGAAPLARFATRRTAKVFSMPIPLEAPEVLNREFLEIRARLLQIAASLDRLDRAAGSVEDDPRLAKIREALAILEDESADRAERIQLLFSRPYEPAWRAAFKLAPKS